MNAPALLTQAELAFIRQLHQSSSLPDGTAHVQQDRLESLSEFLTQYAGSEHLSLSAHVANQLLIFDVHLNDDQVQLSTPKIVDAGDINRAWRSPLPQPIALQTPSGESTGLWIHQLSSSGALIEQDAIHTPAERLELRLPMDDGHSIEVIGEFVRPTEAGLLAYQLHPIDADSDEQLRRFIYQRHRCEQHVNSTVKKDPRLTRA